MASSSSYNLMHRLRQQGHSTLSRFQTWRSKQSLPPAGLSFTYTPPPRRIRQQQDPALASAAPSSSARPTPTFTSQQSPTDPLSRDGAAPHPFLPFLHPVSQRWRPAPLSHRREAELVNEAFRRGQLDAIPDESPKKKRLLDRLGRGREIEGWTELWRSGGVAAASDSTTGQSAAAKPTASLASGKYKFTDARVKEHQNAILLQMAEAGYGPLQGRNPKVRGMRRFFKGTKGERGRRGKDVKIRKNLQNMLEEVGQWRQVSSRSGGGDLFER